MTTPLSYERLQAARDSRPLCWGRDKPHIFKHEGFWRVSLTPRPALLPLWGQAYRWLSVMKEEGRLL